MTAASSPPMFEQLSNLSQTAWLTAFCHHDCGKAWALERPLSDWLIEQFGVPPFADDLSFFTRHGIAARAKWFDNQIAATLSKMAANNETAEVWTLGAGFDSRWLWVMNAHSAVVSCYREFDLSALLAAKSEILAASVWREQWAKVVQHPGDLMTNAAHSLPRVETPVVVVIEGLLDYFDRERKLALFEALHRNVPRATILFDAQSEWLLSLNNKRAHRATGTADITFAWAPPDPYRFYGGIADFKIISHQELLPELIHYRWPWFRFVPIPKRLKRAYQLITMTRRRQA